MRTILDRGDFVFKPPELGCVLSLSELPGGSGKVYDRSPYGNIGSITGASWVRLPSGLWCLSFDGNDDYINCGNNVSFDMTDAITVEAWVQTKDNTLANAVITSKRLGTPNYIFKLSGGYVRLQFYNGGWFDFSDDTTQIANDEWVQAAVTYDREWVRFYVNGSEVKSFEETTAMVSDASDLHVGKRADAASDYFYGYIGEVRIYNRALSVLEIQNHFNREKHLFGRWSFTVA